IVPYRPRYCRRPAPRASVRGLLAAPREVVSEARRRRVARTLASVTDDPLLAGRQVHSNLLMAQEHSKRLDLALATNRNILDAEGYIVFPGVVDKALLQAHTERLYAEFDALNEHGPLFDGGGGMIMGH